MLSFKEFLEEKFDPSSDTRKREHKTRTENEKRQLKTTQDHIKHVLEKDIKNKREEAKKKIEQKKAQNDPDYYAKQKVKKYGEFTKRLGMSDMR